MKKIKKSKYQYLLKSEDGTRKPWTGQFDTIKDAKKWYNTHGKWWIKEGKKGFLLRTIAVYELCA